jgi:hypothetical protein
MKTTTTTTMTFPFLSLPPELRVMIYTHLLTPTTHKLPLEKASLHYTVLSPSILRVCTLTRDEATPIYHLHLHPTLTHVITRPRSGSMAENLSVQIWWVDQLSHLVISGFSHSHSHSHSSHSTKRNPKISTIPLTSLLTTPPTYSFLGTPPPPRALLSFYTTLVHQLLLSPNPQLTLRVECDIHEAAFPRSIKRNEYLEYVAYAARTSARRLGCGVRVRGVLVFGGERGEGERVVGELNGEGEEFWSLEVVE